MANGFSGRILRVDLSTGRIGVDDRDETYYRTYLGGWNVCADYLLRETPAAVDPLGPDNLLVFAPGVITGAPYSGSGRNSVGARSPLTGAFGTSEVGGYWGAELKHAGWDGIVISGAAERPVWLSIVDDQVELHDARELWGRPTSEVQEVMRGALGGGAVRTALIGLGGENRVRYAGIANDLSHFAGRTGMGAVMGSKRLKGVAVRARGKMSVADPAAVKDLARFMAANVEQLAYGLRHYGTGNNMTAGAGSGNLPTRNYRDGGFADPEAVSAQTIKETLRLRMDSCFACALRCKKVVASAEHDLDPDYGGPEYEGLAAFGPNCGCQDLPLVAKANELCQRFGLDVISTGCTIAFAFECYEHGLLTRGDTDGLDLVWGNAAVLPVLVGKIARREGIGDLLAEGVRRAAGRIGRGAERFALQVKGLEVPMHEPRLKRGLGLGYAVSATGADHNHNMHDDWYEREGPALEEVQPLGIRAPVPIDDLGPHKVDLYSRVAHLRVANNCMVLCSFLPWSYEQKVELVRACTGWDLDLDELQRVGERGVQLAHVYNLREGFGPTDDWLPERFFTAPAGGPLTRGIDREQLAGALDLYYQRMGWDRATGWPAAERLAALDLGWAAGKLGTAPAQP